MAIREFFSSRFPKGLMVEVDYSQLEVYALAILSGDNVLKDDLLSGADLHAINAEALFGKGFTAKQRTYAKRMSFQLQYGAGYKSMAKSLDLSEDITKKFIETYYGRYKGVKEWQDNEIKIAQANREYSAHRTPKGFPAGIYVKNSLTGRRYTYIEEDAPDWSEMVSSFRPTKLKNYPVQGFATGDVVPAMLGVLYKRLKESGLHALLVNTVHDSIAFDCPYEEITQLIDLIKEVLGDTRRIINNIYRIKVDMEFPSGIEVGNNLNEMVPWEVFRDTL